jgi:hypothetical protein
MNYYGARELKTKDGKPSGLWHFTKMRDGQIWAVGYCAEHEGHATKEEAQECYRKYILEHMVSRGRLTEWHSCRVCRAPAKNFADVGGLELLVLCDEHNTTQQIEKLTPHFTEVISSY